MTATDNCGRLMSQIAYLFSQLDENAPVVPEYKLTVYPEIADLQEELHSLRADYIKLLEENNKLHAKLKKARKEKKRFKRKYLEMREFLKDES